MKVIIMTGATSGIGAEAVKHFAEQPDTLTVTGTRGSGRLVPQGTEVFPLDLSSLKSVRSFADAVKQRLGNTPIDILVLNAGARFKNNLQRSEDGFEMTFATNHLSHYLLARLLMPNMAKGGKCVITTSDTHDPAIFPLAPKTLDTKELAHPTKSSFGQGLRTYAASKLCNLLTARAFASLELVKERGISMIAYNPGLTGGTTLGKPSPVKRVLMSVVFRLIGVFRPSFFMSTPECSGEALAELALGKITLPTGRVYASLVKGKITFPDPALLAQNNDTKDVLWRDSAAMVGLPEQV